MFTGFASENTPAIQVWEYSRAVASTSALRSISLADDCAPIQYFKTGGSSNFTIDVYLPACPIEGKQIKIVNSRYGSASQVIFVYSSDTNNGGTNGIIYSVGVGQTLDLCYSKNFISFGPTSGAYASGWITLNQSPVGAANYYGAAVGNNNYATGANSGVYGGDTNLASGQYSFVGGGFSNTINSSATGASIVGGSSNTSSSSYSTIIGGVTNSISGAYVALSGGSNNIGSGAYSAITGGAFGATRSIIGSFVTPASNAPIASASGVSQSALLVLGVQTTDATATVLRSNSSAASTTNQVILPNNSAYFFRGEVVAGVTGAGNTKGWTIEGVIKRGANAASTALVGTPTVTSLYADAGATTWSIAVTADTTNGGLKVEVTGQAATTIRWVAQIRTTEMTF